MTVINYYIKTLLKRLLIGRNKTETVGFRDTAPDRGVRETDAEADAIFSILGLYLWANIEFDS